MSKAISFIIGAEFAWLWFIHEPALATWLILAFTTLSIYYNYKLWQIEQKYQNKLSKK